MSRERKTTRASVTLCAIVLIDQGPLRKAASTACTAALAQLEQKRAAWHRFEREDKPSFVRWRAREFGPLLSELRDLEVQIRESEALVHEVEMEMRRGFYDPQSAYQRVMFRRGDPSSVAEEPEMHTSDRTDGERPLSDFEQEALFQEWVQKFIGTNPDKLDDDAYSTTFEAFKAHMFRSCTDQPPPPQKVRRREWEEELAPEEAPNTPVDARLKELYRLLVRRLHPDLRADGSATVSALWHEVQEAYAATDIAQLEILLALSDIESDRVSEQTSVSQMRAVLAELERALFALEDSLRQARDDDAWDFAHSGAFSGLRVRVERELEANLRSRSQRLHLLQHTIDGWSRTPRKNQARDVRPVRGAAVGYRSS